MLYQHFQKIWRNCNDHFEAVKENVNESLAERAGERRSKSCKKEAAEAEDWPNRSRAEKAAQEEVERKNLSRLFI